MSPVFNPNLDPPTAAACLSTSIFSSKLVTFSSITIAVIIFVVDAIGTCLFSDFPQITVLLALSYITAYLEFIFGVLASFAFVISSSSHTKSSSSYSSSRAKFIIGICTIIKKIIKNLLIFFI